MLPAALAGYRPADLDELCAAGEVVWVGAGALGPTDGRARAVVLCFRDRLRLLAPGPRAATPGPTGRSTRRIREHLRPRGRLVLARARRGDAAAPTTSAVLAALWDLVWAGEVTNDTLGARCARCSRGKTRGHAEGPAAALGRLTRLGPPAGAGRWSLVAPLLEPAPTPTEPPTPAPCSCSTATAW